MDSHGHISLHEHKITQIYTSKPFLCQCCQRQSGLHLKFTIMLCHNQAAFPRGGPLHLRFRRFRRCGPTASPNCSSTARQRSPNTTLMRAIDFRTRRRRTGSRMRAPCARAAACSVISILRSFSKTYHSFCKSSLLFRRNSAADHERPYVGVSLPGSGAPKSKNSSSPNCTAVLVMLRASDGCATAIGNDGRGVFNAPMLRGATLARSWHTCSAIGAAAGRCPASTTARRAKQSERLMVGDGQPACLSTVTQTMRGAVSAVLRKALNTCR